MIENMGEEKKMLAEKEWEKYQDNRKREEREENKIWMEGGKKSKENVLF